MSGGGHGGGEGGEGMPPLEAPHEEGEPWLVSYADMMTLLFGFFVLMYAFAIAKLKNEPADQDKMVLIRKELAHYFGGQYQPPLEKVAAEIKPLIASSGLAGSVTTRVTPEGLEVLLQSAAMFASGRAELRPEVEKIVDVLAEHVHERSKSSGLAYKIAVEGHTDDVPIARSATFPSNWELSSARAAHVVRIFEAKGFDGRALVANGYGSTRPLLANRDATGAPLPANMDRNRRVLIKIMLAGDDGHDPHAADSPLAPPAAAPAATGGAGEAPKGAGTLEATPAAPAPEGAASSAESGGEAPTAAGEATSVEGAATDAESGG